MSRHRRALLAVILTATAATAVAVHFAAASLSGDDCAPSSFDARAWRGESAEPTRRKQAENIVSCRLFLEQSERRVRSHLGRPYRRWRERGRLRMAWVVGPDQDFGMKFDGLVFEFDRTGRANRSSVKRVS